MNEKGFDFGARLRHVREVRGLTQGDVADIIGISLRNYQYYEHGKHRLPTATLYSILHVLDVSADYFFGLVSNPESHKTINSSSWDSFDVISNAEKTEREIGKTISNIRNGLFAIISNAESTEVRSEIKEVLRKLEEVSILSEENAETLRNALSRHLKNC